MPNSESASKSGKSCCNYEVNGKSHHLDMYNSRTVIHSCVYLQWFLDSTVKHLEWIMGRSSLVSRKFTAMTSLDLTFWKSEDSEHAAFGAPNHPEQFDSQNSCFFRKPCDSFQQCRTLFNLNRTFLSTIFPEHHHSISCQPNISSYFIHMTVIIY